MSTHKCEVVRVVLREHPNADVLSIVDVFGWQCVVRTEDWKDGDLAVYIPPESIVPDTEEIKNLGGVAGRIKAMKLRGVISLGLLIHAPEEATEGDDLMVRLGITHYEPPLPMSSGGEAERGPAGHWPHYDVENFRNAAYGSLLVPGEEVVVTEKIHGANARYVWTEDRQWAGSHKEWKREDPGNLYWQVLIQNPWLEDWCREHPNIATYGEAYGQVQDLKYGTGRNEIRFAAFDILKAGRWLGWDDAQNMAVGLQWVPILYRGSFYERFTKELAEGDSSIPGAIHLREGVVVRPATERWSQEIGRVQLKLVSNRYLTKKKKK